MMTLSVTIGRRSDATPDRYTSRRREPRRLTRTAHARAPPGHAVPMKNLVHEHVRSPEDRRETAPVGPVAISLHEAVARTAARVPDAVAVSDDRDQLTYATLVRRARHLAYRLHAAGVHGDACVGVLLDRTVELVV